MQNITNNTFHVGKVLLIVNRIFPASRLKLILPVFFRIFIKN